MASSNPAANAPSSSANAPSSLRIADPDGDVILVVGTKNPVSIRACSKVLGLASPVFKVMFGPNFLEGSQLSCANPHDIHLPEDHPEAMAYLCSILHFRRRNDEDMPRALFEEVALLCDKYDCAHAVSHWSNSMLEHFATTMFVLDSREHNRRMIAQICISYIYNNHAAFWKSTKALLEKGLSRDDTRAAHYGHVRLSLLIDRVPSSLFCMISSCRGVIVQNLIKGIERVISPHLAPWRMCLAARGPSIAELTDLTPSECALRLREPGPCERAAKGLYYFEELNRLGVWPLTESMQGTSIMLTMDRLSQFRNYQAPMMTPALASLPIFGNPRFTKCDCITEDFHEQLEALVDENKHLVKGMCLRCVTERSEFPLFRNCAAEDKKLHNDPTPRATASTDNRSNFPPIRGPSSVTPSLETDETTL